MEEDIKANLEWLKDCAENGYIFETGDSKLLLDYITNLQKKYEEADYDRHKLFEAKEKLQNDYQEAVDKITNLQEENQRLRKEIELCKKNGNL